MTSPMIDRILELKAQGLRARVIADLVSTTPANVWVTLWRARATPDQQCASNPRVAQACALRSEEKKIRNIAAEMGRSEASIKHLLRCGGAVKPRICDEMAGAGRLTVGADRLLSLLHARPLYG